MKKQTTTHVHVPSTCTFLGCDHFRDIALNAYVARVLGHSIAVTKACVEREQACGRVNPVLDMRLDAATMDI